MRCKECKAHNIDGSNFCKKCGSPLDSIGKARPFSSTGGIVIGILRTFFIILFFGVGALTLYRNDIIGVFFVILGLLWCPFFNRIKKTRFRLFGRAAIRGWISFLLLTVASFVSLNHLLGILLSFALTLGTVFLIIKKSK